MGLWQPLVQFVYSLALGSFKSEDFICLMDAQAEAAQKAGRIRVNVVDNSPIHTSKIVKEKIKK